MDASTNGKSVKEADVPAKAFWLYPAGTLDITQQLFTIIITWWLLFDHVASQLLQEVEDPPMPPISYEAWLGCRTNKCKHLSMSTISTSYSFRRTLAHFQFVSMDVVCMFGVKEINYQSQLSIGTDLFEHRFSVLPLSFKLNTQYL